MKIPRYKDPEVLERKIFITPFVERLFSSTRSRTARSCTAVYLEMIEEIASEVFELHQVPDLDVYKLDTDVVLSVEAAKALCDYLLEVISSDFYQDRDSYFSPYDLVESYEKVSDLYRPHLNLIVDKYISPTGGLKNV